MGECTFKLTKQPDFGDRRYLLDIGPTWIEQLGKSETDPGSIINGGSGVPVLRPEAQAMIWQWGIIPPDGYSQEEEMADEAARLRFSDDGLSVRAMNALIISGCRTAEEASALHEIDLLLIPSCGKRTIAEIEAWLKERGLHLRQRRCNTCGQILP